MTGMPFETDDLMAELEQAVADLNAFASVFRMPDGDVTETDRRHVVSATITPNLTVAALVVQPTWERTVTAEELASCVDEALGRATTKAMGIDPDTEVSLDEPPADVTTPVTEADRAEAHRLLERTERQMLDQADSFGRDPRAAEDRIERLVAQMEGAIASTEGTQAEGGPDEPQRYYSENHMVSMSSAGMSFMGTTINLNWLRGKSGTAVTQCLTEILEQAPQDQATGFAQALRAAFGDD